MQKLSRVVILALSALIFVLGTLREVGWAALQGGGGGYWDRFGDRLDHCLHLWTLVVAVLLLVVTVCDIRCDKNNSNCSRHCLNIFLTLIFILDLLFLGCLFIPF